MTIEELLKELRDITGEKLDTIQTHDGKLIEVVDEHRNTCFIILEDKVYVTIHKMNEFTSMTFGEYLEYVKELNEVEE